MELIDYESFGKIRLKDFVNDFQTLMNWEYEGEKWTGEGIGFTEWLRPVENEHITQSISLDLLDLDEDVSWSIFEKLGLELEKGMSKEEIIEDFGKPLNIVEFKNDRETLEYILSNNKNNEYQVTFTVQKKNGLIYLNMLNHEKVMSRLKQKYNFA